MVKSGSDIMQNEGKVLILNSITSSNIEKLSGQYPKTPKAIFYPIGLSIASKGVLELYVTDSNESLQFRLIRDESELKTALSEENAEDAKLFAPEMSHQIYGDK